MRLDQTQLQLVHAPRDVHVADDLHQAGQAAAMQRWRT
jgi:hypothetical protein